MNGANVTCRVQITSAKYVRAKGLNKRVATLKLREV
jgi:hypothetical protein